MSKSILAVRHVPFEDLGLLAPLLHDRGYTRVYYRDAGVDALPADAADAADLLVVLGGPIGAEDDRRYPFLRDELRLIERRLARGTPLLGICLGAQLMARALGATVQPMPHRKKEIGFAPLTLTEAGGASPLAALPDALPVLHWHGDQFALPPGLPSLATTPLCPHQAFMAHPAALALQFHLEADPARIESWLIGHATELHHAGVDVPGLRHAASQHGPALAAGLGRLLDEWAALHG